MLHSLSLLALTALATGPARPGEAELAVALDALRPEAIAADVTFLACDEMRGRGTPSLELRVAARYIAARLAHLGVPPGGTAGYLYPYQLEQPRISVERSSWTLGGTEEPVALAFGSDLFFDSTRAVFDHRFEGELVFCGSGARADYEQAAPQGLAGRWAVCFDSDTTAALRRRNAERAGAAGLVVLTPLAAGDAADAPTESIAERFGDNHQLLTNGRISYPDGEEAEQRPQLPQLYLERAASERLLGLAAARAGAEPGAWRPAVGAALGVTLKEERVLEPLVTVENVCGLWTGSDPVLSKEVLIVSAHYDHLGVRGDNVYNGADDNGSGCSALLALAEGLAARGPLRRSVLLIWVSGEEHGLYGSRAWASAPSLPAGFRAVADINLDMVGRNAPDELYVTPSSRMSSAYNGLVRRLERLAPLEGFPELRPCDDYYERSDHKEFARLGIPVAFLFAGVHEDYHKPTDEPEKIDADKVRRVARLVLRVLEDLQDDELDL